MTSIPSYSHYSEPSPTLSTTYSFINKADLEYAPDFFVSEGSCCGHPHTTYTSFDPRLRDTARNIQTTLDTPVLQPRGVQPLNAPTTNTMRSPRFYSSYSDIDAGQIVYYSDPSMGEAYADPIYVIQAENYPEVFVDPMGAYKPQYNRIPLTRHNRNVSEYTFDQDQMEFREDLISRQSRLINQMDPQMYNYYFVTKNDP